MINKSIVIKELKEVLRWKATCRNDEENLGRMQDKVVASNTSYDKARASLRKQIEDCLELYIELQEDLYRIRPALKDDVEVELITINAKEE